MDNQRKFIIRPITADDDAAIAAIIRDNLRAAHLDIPGTAYFDPELDHLSDFYNAEPQRRKSSWLHKTLSRNPHQPARRLRPLRKTRLQKHPPARADHPHNDGSVLYQGAVTTKRENGTHHTEKICVMRTIFVK